MEIERWKKFSKSQQLLMVGAEFMRAKNWQPKDQEKFLLALERAFELIDLTFQDPKWKNNLQMILRLREIVGQFYTSQRTDDVFLLYKVL